MRKQIDILCGGETAFERVAVDVADVLGITCGGRCGDIRTNTRNAAGMLIVVPSAENDSSRVARTIDVAKKLGKPYHVLQPDSPGENVGWKCQKWLYGLMKTKRRLTLLVVCPSKASSAFDQWGVRRELTWVLMFFGRWSKAKIDERNDMGWMMAKLGRLRCGLEVYARCDEQGSPAHFHVVDFASFGCRFHAALLMERAGYYVHPVEQYPYFEGRHDRLSARQLREVIALLNEKGHSQTVWQFLVSQWNQNLPRRNEKERLPMDLPMPNYLETEDYDESPNWNTLGWLKAGGTRYGVFVGFQMDRPDEVPLLQIHIDEPVRGESFWFKVSLIDLILKDEPTLHYQRDLRDLPAGVIRQRGRCSWKGYGQLKRGLMRFLKEKPKDARGGCRTNLLLAISLWNMENRVACNGRAVRNRFQRYLTSRHIDVPDKYLSLLGC